MRESGCLRAVARLGSCSLLPKPFELSGRPSGIGGSVSFSIQFLSRSPRSTLAGRRSPLDKTLPVETPNWTIQVRAFSSKSEHHPSRLGLRGKIPLKDAKGQSLLMYNHTSKKSVRGARDFTTSSVSGASTCSTMPGPQHKAYIALGSNMGDRVSMIEQACLQMESQGIKIKRTSGLFETAPMYVTEQEAFVNGVCEIETSLGPIELLDTLQSIESEMGRRKIVDKGPRVIDLDILLYDNVQYSHDRLNIPHKLMLEREFVLRPLCQLIPHNVPPVTDTGATYQSYLQSLPVSEPRPLAITPISTSFPHLNASDPKRQTHIMAVLNVTPDSFSDGGCHSPSDLAALTETVRSFIQDGATMIDVGGESTRPNAASVSEEEELSRVIPTIKHIRSLPEANSIAISIDTYRATVAKAAVMAGADIINDVSGGLMDPEMLPTVARLQKTIVLMHMRGTPKTMMKLNEHPNGVISGVGHELVSRIQAAEDAGIRRWRIIADPGVGFAKNQVQNLTLLRDMRFLRDFEGLEHIPWLVGTSRKGFIGRITQVKEASERVWGTAAAVTAAVEGGADIVRVHDTKEMTQVVRMADAIYRHGSDESS